MSPYVPTLKISGEKKLDVCLKGTQKISVIRGGGRRRSGGWPPDHPPDPVPVPIYLSSIPEPAEEQPLDEFTDLSLHAALGAVFGGAHGLAHVGARCTAVRSAVLGGPTFGAGVAVPALQDVTSPWRWSRIFTMRHPAGPSVHCGQEARRARPARRSVDVLRGVEHALLAGVADPAVGFSSACGEEPGSVPAGCSS